MDEFETLFKDKEHAALYRAFIEHHVIVEKRVRSLERWRWMQAGGFVLAAAAVPIFARLIGH